MQIDLYNHTVEKEGTEGEEEAKKAYRAARQESDDDAEKAIGEKVSSALIDRVIIFEMIICYLNLLLKSSCFRIYVLCSGFYCIQYTTVK